MSNSEIDSGILFSGLFMNQNRTVLQIFYPALCREQEPVSLWDKTALFQWN